MRLASGTAEGPDYLSVAVGPSSYILAFFKGGIHDPRSGTSRRIRTREYSGPGSFEDFRSMLDIFMDDYLRVNECGQ